MKPGDFIRVEGKLFRIADVDQQRYVVHTELLDRAGQVVSGCPCEAEYPDGTPLEPVAVDEAITEMTYPENMTDGLTRARHVSRQHELVLSRSGLVDDDDDEYEWNG